MTAPVGAVEARAAERRGAAFWIGLVAGFVCYSALHLKTILRLPVVPA